MLAGGTGVGHEVCLRLARAGAGVLVADPDLKAAEATAAVVRSQRVSGWALQVHPGDDDELRMLAARARDLGGADVLVTTGLGRARTTVLAGLLLAHPVVTPVRDVGSPARVAVGVLGLLTTAAEGTVVAIG